jgi:hypothetical protein
MSRKNAETEEERKMKQVIEVGTSLIGYGMKLRRRRRNFL